MTVKVLLVVLLCLFSASVICSVATTVMDTSLEHSWTEPAHASYLTLGGCGNEPEGKDKGGGGWP